MKIQLNMTGKVLGKLDFGTLRAGLAAAQASTPTAAASERVRMSDDPAEALTRLFTEKTATIKEAAALHGSFNPGSVPGIFNDPAQR